MSDPDPKISAKAIEMSQRLSPEERLKIGFSINHFSKQLIIQSILREKPNLSENELRKEFFLKFYGQDFDQATREKIADYFLHLKLK